MTAAAFVIPGDLALPTGGYAYDRRVLALLARHGITASHVALPGSFPDPTVSDLAASEQALAALPTDTVLLIDGLAYGAMPGDVVARIRQPIVALVHHPLCLEAGLAPMRARYLQQTEQMALAFATRVIVTSPMTGRLLVADFGVAAEKITVAEPGTDRVPRTQTATGRKLLAVGTVVPRKGYRVLIEALRTLAGNPDWSLVIAGALDRDPAEADAVRHAIVDAGLDDRIRLAGAVSTAELEILYRDSRLFVMPSLFEGYGMALAEAMARGLPIVCTTGGAAAETAPSPAAIRVRPGDPIALRAALARVLDDDALLARMADASWAAGRKLPAWDDTARSIAGVLVRAADRELAS